MDIKYNDTIIFKDPSEPWDTTATVKGFSYRQGVGEMVDVEYTEISHKINRSVPKSWIRMILPSLPLEEVKSSRHKCKCDIKVLMSRGCQCGGV